jgi:hypothetical protein
MSLHGGEALSPLPQEERLRRASELDPEAAATDGQGPDGTDQADTGRDEPASTAGS